MIATLDLEAHWEVWANDEGDCIYNPTVSRRLTAIKQAALEILDDLLPDVPVLVPPEELSIKDALVDRSTPAGRFMVFYRERPVCDRVFETQAAALLWIKSQLVRDALPVSPRLVDLHHHSGRQGRAAIVRGALMPKRRKRRLGRTLRELRYGVIASAAVILALILFLAVLVAMKGYRGI